jgi:mannose-1-phosphate guanylyltransferase
MKAFILAAGVGTRLRPLTDHTPKCMVPIRGVPMLAIWLKICSDLGVDEVLINLHSHVSSVQSFLESSNFDINVRVAEEQVLLGSAGTLRANQDWVAGEDYFWVFYADVLNRADLKGMARFHALTRPAATLGVYQVPDPHRCGIVSVGAEGIVEEFVEKPQNPTSNLAFAGLLIGTPRLLEAIPQDFPADIGFDVLPKLTRQMRAFPIHDYLIDIGTIENYQRAQETWPGFSVA